MRREEKRWEVVPRLERSNSMVECVSQLVRSESGGRGENGKIVNILKVEVQGVDWAHDIL